MKKVFKILQVLVIVLFGLLQVINHLIQQALLPALGTLLIMSLINYFLVKSLIRNEESSRSSGYAIVGLTIVFYSIYWLFRFINHDIPSTGIRLVILNGITLSLLLLIGRSLIEYFAGTLRFSIGSYLAALLGIPLITTFYILQPWVYYGRFEISSLLVIFVGVTTFMITSVVTKKSTVPLTLLATVLLAFVIFYPTNFSHALFIGYYPMTYIPADALLLLIASMILTLVITCAVYWPRHRWIKALRDQPICHRGFYDETHEENTLAAYQRAIDHQFIIECDVRLTKDGHLVMFHDETLIRQFNDPRAIEDCTYESLQQLHYPSGEIIPTLRQSLHRIAGKVIILLEIKPMGKRRNEIVKKVSQELETYEGKVALQSFDPLTMLQVAELAPQYPRGQLYYTYENAGLNKHLQYALAHLWLLLLYRPDFINGVKHYRLPLAKLLQSLIPSIGYTVQSELEDESERDWYDNMIFEHFIPKRFHS